MSKLTDTRRAYEKFEELLNQEILKRRGNAAELERHREALQAAFYLLGFGQFEHLVKAHTKTVIEQHASGKKIDGYAWRHFKQNLNGVSLRAQLDVIFHGNDSLKKTLNKNYDIRNEVAHNYRSLPPEARSISGWLNDLEKVVDEF